MKKIIALFLHHPFCSTDSVNGIIQSLIPRADVKIFTRHKVHDGFFDDVDLVIFPGGEGDASAFETLLKDNRTEVRRFLNRGGKYLGIGLGAYWADSNYFDILEKTRVVQYIKRPDADIKSSHATTTPVIWRGEPQRMYFNDGPTFIGGDFEKMATYANGDPMAIVQGAIGLIGCHLESEPHWYMKKNRQSHWHQHTHQPLLLQFVVDFLLEDRQLPLF